jgi:hypothetical protein
MKPVALSLALSLGLIAAAASAGEPVQAKLIGQRVVTSFPGNPVLVCEYAGPEARYEVVASAHACAPLFKLSDEPAQGNQPASLARAP